MEEKTQNPNVEPAKEMTEAELSELSEKLVSLPKLTRVDLTGTGVALEQMTQLCEKYPAVDFVFSFELFGVPISTGDTFLDFTGIEMESTETVESIFPVMHHLEKVDMTDTGFDDETLDAMDRRWENIRVVWTMHIDAALRCPHGRHGLYRELRLLRHPDAGIPAPVQILP